MTDSAPLGLIGRYELIARLATGGMGEVFLARTRGAGGFEKQVVIKRILPHLASDPGFVQRFIEEGKLVVKLRHANIAQVLDMGEQAGVFFIAMEHVDGKDLAELLRLAKATRRRLPTPLVVLVLMELLEALDHAHRATEDGRPLGIIHRDVSPSNVLVSRAGEVKLVDFGIARATERLQASTTGVIRGKYGYMSPQQAAGAELDARSDLFSVGVVAWEMLAGARPFDGPSDLLTLDRVRFHDPGPLQAAAPEVPEDLSAWVGRLLAKSPDDRFASADDALKALRAHVLRSGQIASARDLADWVEALLAELPPALRTAVGAAALSLDDVLKLGLPSAAAGPHTMDAVLRTPSAPGPSARTPAPAPPEAALAPPDASPSPATPAAATPTTTTGAPPRRRLSFMVLLVALNLALIAVVLVLVLRSDGSADAPDTTAARDAVAAPTSPTAPALAAADLPDARPAEVVAAADTATREVITPPPVRAGAVFGEGLVAAADMALVADVEVTFHPTPAGAVVTVAGFGATRRVTARPGTTLRVAATARDHQRLTRTLLVGDEDQRVELDLVPVPKFKVAFAFYPANAKVFLDGAPYDTGKRNRLVVELAEGDHELEIVAGERRTSKRFTVLPKAETMSLGTLEVP